MAYHFQNVMPDFSEEIPSVHEAEEGDEEEEGEIMADQGTEASLLKLIYLPYPSLSLKLQLKALRLKETIVTETWGLAGRHVQDFTLYSGLPGTALLLFKSYQVTHNRNDLNLCSEILKACDNAPSNLRDVTFLCGRAGVCALGAVVAKHEGSIEMVNYYLTRFNEIKIERDHSDELLYGRAGFLWACLFLNKHLGQETIPSTYTSKIVKEVIKNGRKLGSRARCPLMYEWYGERYWGAGHGLSGILNVLMYFELLPDERDDVKKTLKYMIKNRLPNGNYPAGEEDLRRDVQVHWCHGAPGTALTLVKAAKVFGDKEFLEAAIDAAEVVWNRGLLKRVGICHGISGNAYVFLSLYRLTGNVKFLYRAKAFACFLLDRREMLITAGEMHGGDSPFSVFEGSGGVSYLFLDMIDPSNAKFPGHEI